MKLIHLLFTGNRISMSTTGVLAKILVRKLHHTKLAFFTRVDAFF